jgi:hypothetical protein
MEWRLQPRPAVVPRKTAIKGDPALAATRVALMSAVIGERGLRDGGEEVGADAYFGKPFDSESVKRGVCQLLGRASG